MIVNEDELYHYGTPRKSGRYQWGSGDQPFQGGNGFLAEIYRLKKEGLSEADIAKGLGMTTTELRARKSYAKSEKKSYDIALATRLKEKGMSNTAIAERMNLNESSVRALLKPDAGAKRDKATAMADILKDEVDKNQFIDFGVGVASSLGTTDTQLKTSVQMLKDQGYEAYEAHIKQINSDNYTNVRVLCPPGTSKADLMANLDKIRTPGVQVDPDTDYITGIKPPVPIASKRLGIRYGDEGGVEMDGTMQIRRGVDDLNLGAAHYAQVRISVDGTHYLKGMAVYSDDLPPGVDIMFNTNKKNTGNKLDALKPMKNDPENPFGATIK